MRMIPLGNSGQKVSSIGLGCMGMSDLYGPSDRAESIATIHAAIDAGITLLDTGDFYGMGHNEMLIGEALKGRLRDQVQLSVKFGALRDASGTWLGYDARPKAVRNFSPIRCSAWESTTIGAIADLVKAGYVRHIGLSEVGPQKIRRAAAVHPISDLQIEYSLISRGIEDEIVPVCRELGIAVTAYGVLSRGLISGHWHRRGWLHRCPCRGVRRRRAIRRAGREGYDRNSPGAARTALHHCGGPGLSCPPRRTAASA
ncbi:aryl-alcohol dehydrogenase-like predicted oxidoreductase [Sinorhizobium medicae]